MNTAYCNKEKVCIDIYSSDVNIVSLIIFANVIGYVKIMPTMQFSLEFLEILSQNHNICYHSLFVSGISEIMDCWILINILY